MTTLADNYYNPVQISTPRHRGHDADLIACCRRIVEIERQRDTATELQDGILIGKLSAEVAKLRAPTSLNGAKALAAAATALAPRNTEGGLLDSQDDLSGHWLAFAACEFIANWMPTP